MPRSIRVTLEMRSNGLLALSWAMIAWFTRPTDHPPHRPGGLLLAFAVIAVALGPFGLELKQPRLAAERVTTVIVAATFLLYCAGMVFGSPSAVRIGAGCFAAYCCARAVSLRSAHRGA